MQLTSRVLANAGVTLSPAAVAADVRRKSRRVIGMVRPLEREASW
jgi:hypothetical protein